MSHIPKYDHQAATSQVTIAGLDEALGENIHPSQNVLLLGPPPSGRFTLAIQFLASGLGARECALLITTGDTPSAIKKRVRATGWNWKGMRSKASSCMSPATAPTAQQRRHGQHRKRKPRKYPCEDLQHNLRLPKRDHISAPIDGHLEAAEATSIFILEDGGHDGEIIRVLRSMSDGVLMLDGSVNMMARGVPTS